MLMTCTTANDFLLKLFLKVFFLKTHYIAQTDLHILTPFSDFFFKIFETLFLFQTQSY